ncbi:uncharacterized protein LOC132555930 [Ylistrum balloti]|uniref:uncharacterized protein LOC132555930 n=1 Tax=Ylistrum balloti TaxID=509963 RepID=UPI002905E410|nr:uncharacterized protein LOC132555930 [Ylistrum balloti]
MPMRQLEKEFMKTYGKHLSDKRFKDVAGIPLDLFIDKYPQSFEKYSKKGEVMLRSLMRKPTNKIKSPSLVKRCDSASSSVGTDTSFYTANENISDVGLSENESYPQECYLDDKQNIDDKNLTSSQGDDDDCLTPRNAEVEDASDSSGEWKEVRKRKKGKAKTSSRYSQKHSDRLMSGSWKTPLVSTIQTNRDTENQRLLQDLLSQPEDKKLRFVPENVYRCHLKCMVDIVSMWNTPCASPAYIVLGVAKELNSPLHLQGLVSQYNLQMFKSYFDEDIFTTVPEFSYFEATNNDKAFGVFTIPSSEGHTKPCIVNCSKSDSMQIVQESQLWYRPGLENIVCEPREEAFTQIYNWFYSKPSSSALPPEEEIGYDKEGEKTGSFTKHRSPHIYKTISDLQRFINIRKDHFVLIAGDVPSGLSHLDAVSLIPWIAVFDLDANSRDNGLLRANEPLIAKDRSLQITTWKDPAASIVEEGTRWCFIRGRRDDPTSKINPIGDVRKWLRTVQSSLDAHMDQLRKFASDYTILNIVVLWPSEETIAPFVQKILSKLDENIDPPPKIILFMPQQLTSVGPAKHVYELLCSEYQQNLTVFQVDFKEIMKGLKSFLPRNGPPICKKFELPHSDEYMNHDITDENAAWLREDLNVLFLKSPYVKESEDLEVLQEEKNKFYRGGTLHWSTWYGCNSRSLDVPRDVRDSFAKTIQERINENRGCLIYLYHDPGSGGTTLSQRLLWDFHTKVPSIHLKTRTYTSTRSLRERIDFLYEKTLLPVLLLVDGEDETKVKFMFRELNARSPTIVICVKRHPFQGHEKKSYPKVQGHVSSAEAKNLAMQYIEQCKDDEKKQREVSRIYEDVKKNQPHYLYEFGLAAFLHEFTGLASYVKGYLQPHWTPHREGINDIPRILGYLSLAYFYGHTSLPSQFFAELLHKPSNYSVDLDDFPHPIGLFIVPDDTEGRRKNIRICHYLIAKEILEFILGSGKEQKSHSSNDLSISAKQNLSEFCLDLIGYASNKRLKSGLTTETIVHCLTRIFIFRDYKEMGQTTEVRRKPVLSRIMNDIYSTPPSFTERQQVLEKLTQSFPNDASFLAHLGRFYSFCKPDEIEKAEECFKKALELCPKCRDEENLETIDDRSKTILVQVYHMFGTVLQRRLGRYTGNAAHDKPEKETKNEDFRKRLEEICEVAKNACKLFENCRRYTATGQENGYGYIGEITVRLQVCDFVQRNYQNGDNAVGIKGFLSSSGKGKSATKKFLQKSGYIIPNLISECYMVVEKDDIDSGLKKSVIWYNHLFQAKKMNLEGLAVHEDNNSYRLKIAIKKQQYAKSTDSLTLIECVDKHQDIKEIVECYEKIFQNLTYTNILSYRKRQETELEFIEWLSAIRHRLCLKKYTIVDVLAQVEIWDEKIPSAMSKFYIFILKSLLGIGTVNQKGDTAKLLDAQAMINQMQRYGRSVLRPKYPREWMGASDDGIKRLIPGTRYLGLSSDDQMQGQRNTRLFKGTITSPNNKKAAGIIQLDLDDNDIEVRVFFIPNNVNLSGTQYAGKRVEFELAFSLHNGYEAFAVKLLRLYGCTKCSSSAEICSRESSGKCPSCETVIQKDDLTLIQRK